MERIEEFILDGKNVVYIDFSGIKLIDNFISLIEAVKPVIAKYPQKSLYTITNLENVTYDTGIKNILLEYMAHNKPHVKVGVFFGMDGIKRIIAQQFIKLSGRYDLLFAFSKENAVELLRKQD